MFSLPHNPMTPPPMRRVWSWVIALGCVYLLALLSFRLAQFPGLHGDEAWLGLFALRIRDQGLYSPHEMNTYTGSLYAWLLSWVFTYFPPDVFSLRIGGVLLNGSAVVIATWHFAKRFGLGSALVWLYLLGTSALFVFKSRLAWEVTALQNLLLTGILVLCARFLEDRRRAFGDVLAFLVLNYIGVINHFIFISVPASLPLQRPNGLLSISRQVPDHGDAVAAPSALLHGPVPADPIGVRRRLRLDWTQDCSLAAYTLRQASRHTPSTDTPQELSRLWPRTLLRVSPQGPDPSLVGRGALRAFGFLDPTATPAARALCLGLLPVGRFCSTHLSSSGARCFLPAIPIHPSADLVASYLFSDVHSVSGPDSYPLLYSPFFLDHGFFDGRAVPHRLGHASLGRHGVSRCRCGAPSLFLG